MGDLKDAIKNISPLGITGYYGIISRDIEAPDQPAFFVLPEFDYGKAEWGPARWMPRPKTVRVEVSPGVFADVPIQQMPKEGDLCFIGQDNNRAYWITCWWPV